MRHMWVFSKVADAASAWEAMRRVRQIGGPEIRRLGGDVSALPHTLSGSTVPVPLSAQRMEHLTKLFPDDSIEVARRKVSKLVGGGGRTGSVVLLDPHQYAQGLRGWAGGGVGAALRSALHHGPIAGHGEFVMGSAARKILADKAELARSVNLVRLHELGEAYAVNRPKSYYRAMGKLYFTHADPAIILSESNFARGVGGPSAKFLSALRSSGGESHHLRSATGGAFRYGAESLAPERARELRALVMSNLDKYDPRKYHWGWGRDLRVAGDMIARNIPRILRRIRG